MAEIKWTKTYDLKIDNRHFRVAVSEHEDSAFHASCLWYEKGRVLKAPGQLGVLQMQLEQRHASTEAEALTQIKAWAQDKFGELASLIPSAG